MMTLWSSIVGGLLGKVAPAVAEHYRQKQEQLHNIEIEKLKGKRAWEEAKTRRAEASEGRDHDWELESLRVHSTGWKQHWVLFLVSIPMIMVFIPGLEDDALQGFKNLEQTPDWYRWLILLIFTAIYGIRIWRRTPTAKTVAPNFLEGGDGAKGRDIDV